MNKKGDSYSTLNNMNNQFGLIDIYRILQQM